MRTGWITGGITVVVVWLGAVGGVGTGVAQAAGVTEQDALRQRVEQAIGTVQRRYLTAGVHSPWQIMHGVLALGYDMRLRDPENGELIEAIDYICNRADTRGRRILEPASHGLRFIDSYQTQGHPDQFLAIFAQAGVPQDATLQVGETAFTVADLVKQAQADVGRDAETSWTLAALSHYLGPQAEWRNQYDRRYTIRGLVKWELDQSVEGAACGGTHRLAGISFALAKYRQTGQPLEGVWQRAYERTRRYLAKSQEFQNPDGSFSSEFFVLRSRTSDLEDYLHAHGHTLEWVVGAVEQDELADSWVTRAVENLCESLIANRSRPIECGSLYHAGSALRIYRMRRWPASEPATLASQAAAPAGANPPSAP